LIVHHLQCLANIVAAWIADKDRIVNGMPTRPRLSQLCDGTCDRSCDAVIGKRSSPNRNGNRALKVRAKPKKVIRDRSGSGGPVASSNASRWAVRNGL